MKNFVEKIVNQYDTRNPFHIIKDMGVKIVFEPLGTIKGYYHTICGQRLIHINQGLNEHQQMITAAHELGHVLLHPNSNTLFLKNKTFLSVNKLELEANKFAVHLLISDQDLIDNQHFTIDQLSAKFGLPNSLIRLRIGSR